jgi:SAM-dependent methyltransferase
LKKVETPGELKQLDKEFQDLCAGLIVPPGSLFRMARGHLANWGVTVTQKNADWIADRGRRSYYEEWGSTPAETHHAIELAISDAGLEHGNADMNNALGMMAADVIKEMVERTKRRRRLIIADVGSGSGGTTGAVATAIQTYCPELLQFCEFLLIDVAFDRHVFAVRELEGTGAMILPQTSSLEEFFGRTRDGSLDLILSSAVLHHITDPRYISDFHRCLRDDGAVIIGDWYTSVWSMPHLFVDILEAVGASRDQLTRFRAYFGIYSDDAIAQAKRKLTAEERLTNRDMAAFVGCLARRMRVVPKAGRLRLLEAHQSLNDRIEDYSVYGFTTKDKESAERYKAFLGRDAVRRMYPQREFATVIGFTKTRTQ